MKHLILLSIMLTFFNKSQAQNQKPTESIYDIKISGLDGQPIDLSEYKDKFILIVNVASKCGFTGQYEDLQKLFNTYNEKLMIIGVPCNQFGGQEPGTAQDIKSFCQTNYGVSFLMTEKSDVKGKTQHELYKWLTDKSKNGTSNSSVKWNFQKYLIDTNGQLIDYYLSTTKPMSSKITKHLK